MCPVTGQCKVSFPLNRCVLGKSGRRGRLFNDFNVNNDEKTLILGLKDFIVFRV